MRAERRIDSASRIAGTILTTLSDARDRAYGEGLRGRASAH
jgi:hypothetical protein